MDPENNPKNNPKNNPRYNNHDGSAVKVGPAMLRFLNYGYLNISIEHRTFDLMYLFPIARDGYVEKNLLIKFFYLYGTFHHLRLERNTMSSDTLMLNAFDYDIPALKYRIPGAEPHNSIISMNEAINQGLVDNPMNTFRVLKLNIPDFNPSNFNIKCVPDILQLNYVFLSQVPGSNEFNNQEFKERLSYESDLMQDITDVTRDITRYIDIDDVDIYSFITFAFDKNKLTLLNALIDSLTYHPGINWLYLSIIVCNIANIKRHLSMIDPRNDSHRAYFLAVQNGDPNIIKLVKDSIIEWTLCNDIGLYRAFNRDGETGVGKDLYEYAKRIYYN